MPLLGIAIAQSSLGNDLVYPRLQIFFNDKVPHHSLFQHEDGWASLRKLWQNSGHVNLGPPRRLHPKVLIKAVATLEPKFAVHREDGGKEDKDLHKTAESVFCEGQVDSSNAIVQVQPPIVDPEELEDRERARRMRISKANKGNTPWNKGRKHSPETKQRIKERTKLAMQNPKIDYPSSFSGSSKPFDNAQITMKRADQEIKKDGENEVDESRSCTKVGLDLVQFQETKKRISHGVRLGWQRRRKRLKMQEFCIIKWHDLIAETARKGFFDDEELQWNSYEILDQQLRKEWLDSTERKKQNRKAPNGQRAPKSPEQRRKIAEAIAAKWADPEYRSRVSSGMANYHQTRGRVERISRNTPREPRPPRPAKEKAVKVRTAKTSVHKVKRKPQPAMVKKRTAPTYVDPLASCKLEMLKSIRAQRSASGSKKNETLERAKLLISEAKKAVNALEVAATRSPVAQASLIESRKLIAEAVESIQMIEDQALPCQDDSSSVHNKNVGDLGESFRDNINGAYHGGVNGVTSLDSSKNESLDRGNLHNGSKVEKMDTSHQYSMSLSSYQFPQHHHLKPNGALKVNGILSTNENQMQVQKEQVPPASMTVTKKWVCGKLVKVPEGE